MTHRESWVFLHRDGVDPWVGQGEQRVDAVPEAGVLEVDHRHLPGGEVVAGGRRNRGALVRGDDVVARQGVVGDVGAQMSEQAVGHSLHSVPQSNRGRFEDGEFVRRSRESESSDLTVKKVEPSLPSSSNKCAGGTATSCSDE